MKTRAGLVAALTFALLAPLAASANTTSLSYTSSPQSWVGHGETVTVTPDDGFTFKIGTNTQNHAIVFSINNFATAAPSDYRWWELDFAPNPNGVLYATVFNDAHRFPFQGNSPGLDFTGNGRGDNQLTGSFTVLTATYGVDTSVLTFDAIFTQYDENNPLWWNTGEIRWNMPAVPEPATFAMLALGLAGVALVARRSEQAQ